MDIKLGDKVKIKIEGVFDGKLGIVSDVKDGFATIMLDNESDISLDIRSIVCEIDDLEAI